mmetsp:Transcript_26520/g.44332  ORF Transcript_26520/g.44332 Transcript_26520/m.44332 type:complete len:389 (+) Transcript_26520:437-1603(+)
MHTMGHCGRNLEMCLASVALWCLCVLIITTMHANSSLLRWPWAACTTAYAIASTGSLKSGTVRGARAAYSSSASSLWSTMRFISPTVSTGYLPCADSPESITQSAPSNTALATSVHSARVGLGFFCMLSIICVATMTGLPAWLHRRTISFCTLAMLSIGISTAKSPRATMIPSLTSRMLSKFTSDSTFSILEMMWGTWRSCGNPSGPLPPAPVAPLLGKSSRNVSSQYSRISVISFGERTNDAAIKSTLCCRPQRMSSLSLWDMGGSNTGKPGRFTPFLLPRTPVFITSAVTSPFSKSISTARNSTAPSSSKMELPTSTVSSNWWYEIQSFSTLWAYRTSSCILKVTIWPVSSCTFFVPSGNDPVRISGPWVSSMIARIFDILVAALL